MNTLDKMNINRIKFLALQKFEKNNIPCCSKCKTQFDTSMLHSICDLNDIMNTLLDHPKYRLNVSYGTFYRIFNKFYTDEKHNSSLIRNIDNSMRAPYVVKTGKYSYGYTICCA